MAFEALVDYSRKTLDALLKRGARPGSDELLGFAETGRPIQVYNEAAFRHFLRREEKRAARSGRSLLLMVISVSGAEGPESDIARPVAARLFSGLAGCVREIDFVGWYRDRRVLGAVLAQRGESTDAEVERVIVERVTRALREQVSARIADALQVRVVHVDGRSPCSR